ncbi:MBL fold metallo-hydrolase [Rhodococcus kronopolitis]|uniref:MBL fold metallo-hydrolase n=1 Tax=Rhodococcus kronopolitis TaxID=1460226 RepID=A0ABV9FWV9_9NOCA
MTTEHSKTIERAATIGQSPTDWHQVSPISRGVWSISEPGHVSLWLIAGRDQAVLLDTGMGFVPLRPVVEAITDLPIRVVNSHFHFDHVGGNHEFDRVAIHPAGVQPLASPTPSHVLDTYLGYTDRMVRACESVRAADREYLHLLDADSTPRRPPAGLVRRAWRVAPPPATETVADGEVLDLGGRTLTVLHTPGHTPDGICLLDSLTGILFTGDTVNSGPIYAHEPESDLDDFAASTARLAAMKDDVSLVAMNHFGRIVAAPYLLQEVADAFADLEGRRAEARRARDVLGAVVDEIEFAHFSIVVAPHRAGVG